MWAPMPISARPPNRRGHTVFTITRYLLAIILATLTAAPIAPRRRALPVFPCPVCGHRSDELTFRAGWCVRGILGTRVGTYPEPAPVEPGPSGMAAPVEPFPPLDRWTVEPCGHELTPDQAAGIRDQLAGHAPLEPPDQPAYRD